MKSDDAAPSGARIFEVRDLVRWSDVDIAGIIYFGAYVRFLELAETELFRELGFPYSEMFDRLDIWLPRVHLDFDFFAPARMDDVLLCRTYIASLGRSSITMKMAMHNVNRGELDARATLVIVCSSRRNIKSIPIPEPLRTALEGALGTAS